MTGLKESITVSPTVSHKRLSHRLIVVNLTTNLGSLFSCSSYVIWLLVIGIPGLEYGQQLINA
jgi:hypothetical protein